MATQLGTAFAVVDFTSILGGEGPGHQLGTTITQLLGNPSQVIIGKTNTGVLSSDPNVARWTPVTLTFQVPPGYNVAIIAQIGPDAALWMSAYDEALGGAQGAAAIAPLFSGKTTLSIAGTIAGGRLFTINVLPNGGWQREQVKLVPYIALEMS